MLRIKGIQERVLRKRMTCSDLCGRRITLGVMNRTD